MAANKPVTARAGDPPAVTTLGRRYIVLGSLLLTRGGALALAAALIGALSTTEPLPRR